MNAIVTGGAIAWFTAQLTKVVIGIVRCGLRDKTRTLWRAIWAGGMPSAHSALMTCISLMVFHLHGAQSSLFALSLLLTCIVVYDRSRMYKIYTTFQKRYPPLKRTVQNDPLLKDLVGYRISEIAAGVTVGLLVGLGTITYFSLIFS